MDQEKHTINLRSQYLDSINFSGNDCIFTTVCSNIVSCYKVNSLEQRLSTTYDNDIYLAKLLNGTNILCISGADSISNPYKISDTLIVRDINTDENLFVIKESTPIRNCLIWKEHMLITCDRYISLYTWGNGNLPYEKIGSKGTCPNEKGLCVIDANKKVVVTMGINVGEIAIWNIDSENESYRTIKAHLGNIECITLSQCGRYIATCSERNTLIRVFDTITLKKEYEFRRGSNNVEIFDIAFSHDLKYLSCVSANSTIHIFHLYKNEEPNKNTKSLLSYLPLSYVTPTYFNSEWSCKQYKLIDTYPCKCSFDKSGNLHVVSLSRNYYKVTYLEDKFVDEIIHETF